MISERTKELGYVVMGLITLLLLANLLCNIFVISPRVERENTQWQKIQDTAIHAITIPPCDQANGYPPGSVCYIPRNAITEDIVTNTTAYYGDDEK